MRNLRSKTLTLLLLLIWSLIELWRLFRELAVRVLSEAGLGPFFRIGTLLPDPIAVVAWVGKQCLLFGFFYKLAPPLYSRFLNGIEESRLFRLFIAGSALLSAVLAGLLVGDIPPYVTELPLRQQYILYYQYWGLLFFPGMILWAVLFYANYSAENVSTEGPFFMYGAAATLPGFLGIAVGLLAGFGWLPDALLIGWILLKGSSITLPWSNYSLTIPSRTDIAELETRVGRQIALLADGPTGLFFILSIITGLYISVNTLRLEYTYQMYIYSGLHILQSPISIADALLRIAALILLPITGVLFWVYQFPRAELQAITLPLSNQASTLVPSLAKPFFIITAPLFALKIISVIDAQLPVPIWPVLQLLYPIFAALCLYATIQAIRTGFDRTIAQNPLSIIALPVMLTAQVAWLLIGANPITDQLFAFTLSTPLVHLLLLCIVLFVIQIVRRLLGIISQQPRFWYYGLIALAAIFLAVPT